MMESLPIKIRVNKFKSILLLGACVLFVLIGIWMFMADAEETRYSPYLLKGMGLVTIAFFGSAGVVGAKQTFNSKSGLVINENGIVDHTNASSIGLIEWEDILGIRMTQVASAKILLVDVKDPTKYLEKAPNKMVAKLLELNNEVYGTPLSITSNTLAIKFDKLEKLLQEQLTSKFENKR